MFGTVETMKQKLATYSAREHDLRIEDLVDRFAAADCDVIAVQEVLGRTTELAEAALADLTRTLQRRTNRFYEVRVGPAAEGGMALGFIAAKDRVNIVSTLSYARVELPKVSPKEKPRLFARTPLELQATVYSRESNMAKTVTLVNFHFKSKRGGAADPTGLEWETYRMEMAEALRRIVELRHKNSFASSDTILMLLGDRNSNFDVASARILEGSLSLSSFRGDGGCRLSKRGLPICKADTALPKRLFSVLTTGKSVLSLPGTFEYKGEYSWLDDILMPAESLVYVWKSAYSDNKYSSGVLYKPKEASDHAMVYTKLNW
jgi:endonuclease/exonuclease/phosphatase family metal-dependent hydrolase